MNFLLCPFSDTKLTQTLDFYLGTQPNFLVRVGYFRSGAYRYVFRQLLPADQVNEDLHQYRSDDYIPGATIDHVMKLEAFDFKLARVCQERLLEFEVRLRAAIAHTLASNDVAAHASKEFLDTRTCDKVIGDRTKFEAWTKTWRDAVASGSKDEDFIEHHLLKYPDLRPEAGEPIPLTRPACLLEPESLVDGITAIGSLKWAGKWLVISD
ncbi:Abi family protein [Arthrobacter sp. NQ7]|uniref:Abi family protein n=1 Tax=Arthrobacter sp. NQ7 TaxID=3032303 RepID=UPI0024104AC0|nr:Abi family protein [Arthrobacter sp. NQ7]MDJ0458055.1 Abi family protein [Arthrobacter sp. NQ7]